MPETRMPRSSNDIAHMMVDGQKVLRGSVEEAVIKYGADPRSLTPPKFIASLRDKEAPLLLEERLKHFIAWMESKGVALYDRIDGSPTEHLRHISMSELDNWIEEYVNE